MVRTEIQFSTIIYTIFILLLSCSGCVIFILEGDRIKTTSSLQSLKMCLQQIDLIEQDILHEVAEADLVAKHGTVLAKRAEDAYHTIENAYLPQQLKTMVESFYTSCAKWSSAYARGKNVPPSQLVNAAGDQKELDIQAIHKSIATILPVLEAEQSVLQKRIWGFVIALFSITAIFTVAVPVYVKYNYYKPIKHLIGALKAVGEGKPWDIAAIGRKRDLIVLSGIIQHMVQSHKGAEVMIENIGKDSDISLHNYIDERNPFASTLLGMHEKLMLHTQEAKKSNFINEKLASLEKILKTEQDHAIVNKQIITLLTKSVSASAGILYSLNDLHHDNTFFERIASYGIDAKNGAGQSIPIGAGQLGQMGIERKTVVLEDLPETYLRIQSGLGESASTAVVMVPFIFKNELYGALELGSFHAFEEYQVKWLERAAESLAAHFFNQKINERAKRQLEDLTEKQAKELIEIHRLQEQTYHKLEVQLKEAEEEKMKNQAILEGCVDAVISFNEYGVVDFCNHSAEEIFGYTKKEILQRKIFEWIHIRIDIDGEELKPFYLSQASEKEITVRTEASVKNKAGDDVDVLITSTKVKVQNTILFTFFIQKISADLF